MNIYIIRHAEAESAGGGVSDFDRSLTTGGKERLKSAARVWKRVIPSVDCILSSPVFRAYQTASILKEAFGVNSEIISEYDLSMGAKTEKVIELANGLREKNIFVVGHQPDCSNHVSLLTSTGGINLAFAPGSIAKISFEGKARIGAGIFEFFMPTTLY